jgi:proteic killer suppression protein
VIGSFADERTEDVYHGRNNARTRSLPQDVVKVGKRKLDMLNAAHILDDLRSPPGNRLEQLKGMWAGFYSIRINSQWRIVFRWTDGGPTDVSIVDYH